MGRRLADRGEGSGHKKGRRRSMSFAMLGSGRRHDGASLGIRTNQGGLVPGGGQHGGKVQGQAGFPAVAFLIQGCQDDHYFPLNIFPSIRPVTLPAPQAPNNCPGAFVNSGNITQEPGQGVKKTSDAAARHDGAPGWGAPRRGVCSERPPVMGYSPPSGKYFFASFAFAGPVERNHSRACSGVNSCGSAPGSIGVSKLQFPELVCQST